MKIVIHTPPPLSPRTDGRYETFTNWRVAIETPGPDLFIIIRKGFIFDGASIPRLFWRVWGAPFASPRVIAALVHDWLYRSHVTTRAFADKVYYKTLRRVGYSFFSAGTEWLMLRFFGWFAWHSHNFETQLSARTQGVFGVETSKRSKGTVKMKKKLFTVLAVLSMAMCGCMSLDDASCHADFDGVVVDKSGRLAAGSVKIQSAPSGVESAMVKYKDDTSLFSDEKKHEIDILITGSNSVSSVTSVVHSICNAFIATAPAISGAAKTSVTNSPSATEGK
jgi:hypothetical protein